MKLANIIIIIMVLFYLFIQYEIDRQYGINRDLPKLNQEVP